MGNHKRLGLTELRLMAVQLGLGLSVGVEFCFFVTLLAASKQASIRQRLLAQCIMHKSRERSERGVL